MEFLNKTILLDVCLMLMNSVHFYENVYDLCEPILTESKLPDKFVCMEGTFSYFLK